MGLKLHGQSVFIPNIIIKYSGFFLQGPKLLDAVYIGSQTLIVDICAFQLV